MKKKLCFLVALQLLFVLTMRSQNYSNLQNQELRKMRRGDVVPAGNDLVFNLLEKLKPKNERLTPPDENTLVTINKVTVINDGRGDLTLKVNYTANPSNPVLQCVLVNKKGEVIPSFTVDSAATNAAGETSFNISIKDNAAAAGEEKEFFADYVLLKTYNRSKNNFGEVYYQLNKRWLSGTKITRIVIPGNDAMTRLGRNENIESINNNRIKIFAVMNYTTLQTIKTVDKPVTTTTTGVKPVGKVYDKSVMMTRPVFYNSGIRTIATGTTGTTPTEPARAERVIMDLTRELEMFTDDGFPDIAYQLTNIKLNYIVQTKNKGEFFYIPNSYNIKWTVDNGYDLKMTYSSLSDATAGTGNVRINGTLTPNISRDEVRLVENFLKLYCRKKGLTFVSFNEFPASDYGTNLAESLQAAFDVDKSKVMQTSSNSLRDEVTFSWVVSSSTKDDIQAALVTGGGITAQMSFSEPPPNEAKKYSIRVQVKLDEPEVFGRFELNKAQWRTAKWKNPTAFPIRLNAIHFLDLVSNTEKINVYSCKLNRETIQPGDEVQFNAAAIPSNIDSKFNRIWLDYSVERCEACYQEVAQQLTGGVSASAQEITFQGIGCFDIDGVRANQIQVEVRSKQLDPQGATVITAPMVKLTEAEAEKKVKPLYVPKGQQPDYEYRINFITTDGDSKQSGWIKLNSLNVVIGKKLVKDNCFQ